MRHPRQFSRQVSGFHSGLRSGFRSGFSNRSTDSQDIAKIDGQRTCRSGLFVDASIGFSRGSALVGMEVLNPVAIRPAMSRVKAFAGITLCDPRAPQDLRSAARAFISDANSGGLECPFRRPSHASCTIRNVLRAAVSNGDGNLESNFAQDSISRSSHSSTSQPAAIEGRADELMTDTERSTEILTEFIDERLVQVLKDRDIQHRQTVLLTDGTDTRPYSLSWPNPCFVFHISPEPAYLETSVLFKDLGIKVSRSCLLRHLPLDLFAQEGWNDEDLINQLTKRGYRGDNPSVWVVQISQTLPYDFFKRIMEVGSRLLMKGSTFLGVIPYPYPSSDFSETEARTIVSDLFLGQGFTVRLYYYKTLAMERGLDCSVLPPGSSPFVFIAQQQRLSDLQVEGGLRQVELAEEVEEDGFEDSW